MIERVALRNDIFKYKYCEQEGGWCSNKVKEGYNIGVWKAIQRWQPLVKATSSFVVGIGER